MHAKLLFINNIMQIMHSLYTCHNNTTITSPMHSSWTTTEFHFYFSDAIKLLLCYRSLTCHSTVFQNGISSVYHLPLICPVFWNMVKLNKLIIVLSTRPPLLAQKTTINHCDIFWRCAYTLEQMNLLSNGSLQILDDSVTSDHTGHFFKQQFLKLLIKYVHFPPAELAI